MRSRGWPSPGCCGLAGNGSRFVRTRQRLVDVVHVGQKARRLAIAILRNVDLEVGTNAPRIAAEHDDAVGQQHCLLDVVGHDEDGGRRHLLVEPQLQQLGAQVFGGEDIERRERLVHEEHFRLDHQRARKADALLHAAGELFGIGGFEAVETDGVDHLQRALVALDGAHATRHQRRFDVLQHREPGKQREALEDDGDIRNLPVHRLAVPQHVPGRRLRQGRSTCAAASIFPSPMDRARQTIFPGETSRSVGAITSMWLPSGCG